MLLKDAPAFATVPIVVKKVRFAKTRKNKRESKRETRKNRAEPKPELTMAEALWESYKSAVATIQHLTKSSVY